MSLDFSFTSDDLTAMRATQTGHMLDQCVIITFTEGTRNEYNEDDAPVESESAPVECGLDMHPGSRNFGEEMTVIRYDARLRLPLHTPVAETNHVRIISRFGEAVSPLEFEVLSPIQRGPSGIRLMLRKVVT